MKDQNMARGQPVHEGVFVRNIGLSIIGYIILMSLIMCLLIPGRVVGTIIKAAISITLAVFMINGANWARWLFAIGGLISCLLLIITFIYLDQQQISRFSIIGLLTLFSAAVEITIAGFLLFSERVNKYFGT